MKDLIIVKQLPIIEEQLKALGSEITAKVKAAQMHLSEQELRMELDKP